MARRNEDEAKKGKFFHPFPLVFYLGFMGISRCIRDRWGNHPRTDVYLWLQHGGERL
jgi:hypothetical protein